MGGSPTFQTRSSFSDVSPALLLIRGLVPFRLSKNSSVHSRIWDHVLSHLFPYSLSTTNKLQVFYEWWVLPFHYNAQNDNHFFVSSHNSFLLLCYALKERFSLTPYYCITSTHVTVIGITALQPAFLRTELHWLWALEQEFGQRSNESTKSSENQSCWHHFI